MKEIKFRVYSKKDKKFYYWGFIESGFVGFPNSAELTIEYCRKNSRAYIGLKDKNKKEIYEKDIVKTHYRNDKGFNIGVVEYIAITAHYGVRCGYKLYEFGKRWRNFEVIGSVDKNPELLEE